MLALFPRVLSSVSALLCGARVLDDVRREAQTGQRTRRQARSQVLTSRDRDAAKGRHTN